ncbi:MAG: phosphoethanolamine methyltransferase [Geminicoccaceae bacterium]|nr:phosphoethanolamine methyltransferase [Geminicoccaceae bacterium]
MQQGSLIREGEVFFRQWLRSPKSMGSVFPSSRVLARAIANEVAWQPGQFVVELGGGTGAITQGLIERGIPRENLIVVELETHLFEYLRDRFPGSKVIQGDATRLDEILAHHDIQDIGTVISGLPMVGMPIEFQKAIIEQAMAAMGGKGFMLQYSYSPISPIPAAQFKVTAKLAKFVLWNFPPANVWKYER